MQLQYIYKFHSDVFQMYLFVGFKTCPKKIKLDVFEIHLDVSEICLDVSDIH